MNTVMSHIRQANYDRHGFTEIDHTESDLRAVRADIAEKTDALRRAADLASKRLIMGTLRYGVSTHDMYDYRKRLTEKLKLYDDTGNQEMLIDAINYCVLELNWPNRTDVFFKAEDDSSSSHRGYDL